MSQLTPRFSSASVGEKRLISSRVAKPDRHEPALRAERQRLEKH
jgi:hypothetical protein